MSEENTGSDHGCDNFDELSDSVPPAIFGNPETRRRFIRQVAGTSAAITIGPSLLSNISAGEEQPNAPPAPIGSMDSMKVNLKINGKDYTLDVDPRTTLLDALRERLHLTGSEKGCDHGQCGACTVLVNGRRVNSCLTLA